MDQRQFVSVRRQPENLSVSANTFDFLGKIALITGGNRGIGRATALLFAQSGMTLSLGDRFKRGHFKNRLTKVTRNETST